MPNRLFIVLAIWVLLGTSLSFAAEMEDRPYAVLRQLDKVTGRVSSVVVKTGQSITFETLSITLRACRQSVPPDMPESAAFLEIVDHSKEGQAPAAAFSGWMFSSSPALSAMEHPLYDVWLLKCQDNPQTNAKEGDIGKGKTAPVIDDTLPTETLD